MLTVGRRCSCLPMMRWVLSLLAWGLLCTGFAYEGGYEQLHGGCGDHSHGIRLVHVAGIRNL